MTGSLDGKVQCAACHNYSDSEAFVCEDCGALLPRGLAQRQKRGRDLPREKAEQVAAYERFKLEATHVPRWLRRLGAALDYANDDPAMHRLVQWGSGLIGFGLAFEAADPFIKMIPLPPKVAEAVYVPLQIVVGLTAFFLTSTFIFAIFSNIMGAMRQVYGEEQDARILQGTTSERAAKMKKDR